MADIQGTTTPIEGQAAHDAAVSENPVAVGGRANANEPAVVADGDVSHLWLDLFGRAVVIPGHPSPELPVVVNATASGDTAVLAAPGAGVSLYICKVTIINGGSAIITAHLQEGGTAVNRGPGDLAKDGGGANLDFGARGWKVGDNKALDINLSATGDVWVTVTEHYEAAA